MASLGCSASKTRSADDDVVRTATNRLRRRCETTLISRSCPFRPNARCDNHKIITARPPNGFNFKRRCTDTVQSCRLRLLSKINYLVCGDSVVNRSELGTQCLPYSSKPLPQAKEEVEFPLLRRNGRHFRARARIISKPPEACMLIMRAPCFVIVPTSRATVIWNIVKLKIQKDIISKRIFQIFKGSGAQNTESLKTNFYPRHNLSQVAE